MSKLDDYLDYDDDFVGRGRYHTSQAEKKKRRELEEAEAKAEELTQERLQEYLYYDPETGNFFANEDAPQRPAGSLLNNKSGILIIKGRQYVFHRLAFLYMIGMIPPVVEFKNGDKRDYRWENLAPVLKKKPPPPSTIDLVYAEFRLDCKGCGYIWRDTFSNRVTWRRCPSCQKVISGAELKSSMQRDREKVNSQGS